MKLSFAYISIVLIFQEQNYNVQFYFVQNINSQELLFLSLMGSMPLTGMDGNDHLYGRVHGNS